MIIQGLFNGIWLFDDYLWQEGEGGGGEGGGEKEHIYNRPKGGLVPPPKEGLWRGGGSDGDYWVLILKIIESTDLVRSKNKPRFVTAILSLEYGFLVYLSDVGSKLWELVNL